jgi:hypothetical protein
VRIRRREGDRWMDGWLLDGALVFTRKWGKGSVGEIFYAVGGGGGTKVCYFIVCMEVLDRWFENIRCGVVRASI